MELTKEQKSDLQSLVEHRGFKVFELLLESKRDSLFTELESVNLWTQDVMKNIQEKQFFIQGMRYLIATAKGKSQSVAKADNMN